MLRIPTEKGFWTGSSSGDSGYNTMEADAIRNIADGGAFINPWMGKGNCSVTMNTSAKNTDRKGFLDRIVFR